MSNQASLATRLTAASVEYREKPFELKAGGLSHYYCDLRSGQVEWDMVEEIGEASLAVIKANEIELDVVSAEGIDAFPVQAGLIVAAQKAGIKCLRAEVVMKDVPGEKYGRGVHGAYVQGRRVLPVDGTTTTGGSLVKVVELLRENDAIVTDAYSVVDRSKGLAATALSGIGVNFFAAFGFDESSGLLTPRYNE